MKKQKFMIITCLALLVIALWGIGPPMAQAMPAGPTDETKVPHYYGPYPNWALSQLPGYDITSITVDAGGPGYTTPTVTISDAAGTGSGATAAAVVDVTTGAITAINVLTPGSGYVVPVVTISDAAGTGAAATAVPGTTITGGMKKFVDTLPLLCNPSVAGVRRCREQPGSVPPPRGCRPGDLHHGQRLWPGRRLLRHRPRAAPGTDELVAPRPRDPAARVRTT